jgi:GNAT superfamily N-acetyltransferase
MIDLQDINIEQAKETDYEELTNIAFAAKRYWNYPESYYELWCGELTITSAYINENIVFKAMHENTIVGFYSIVDNPADAYFGDVFVKKGFWLEHIFITPAYHKLGIGRLLINHVKKICHAMGVESLSIFVDPFARGFYDKIGANFAYESKSSVPDRFIPVYELKIL